MKTPNQTKVDRRAIRASQPKLGSEVYTEDGHMLGRVTEVYALTDHGLLARSVRLLNDYGPIGGTSAWYETTDGFLEVRRDVGPWLYQIVRLALTDIVAMEGDYILVGARRGDQEARPGSIPVASPHSPQSLPRAVAT